MSLEKDRRSQGSGSRDTPNKLSAITQASHKASSPFPRIINKFSSRPTTFKKKNIFPIKQVYGYNFTPLEVLIIGQVKT